MSNLVNSHQVERIKPQNRGASAPPNISNEAYVTLEISLLARASLALRMRITAPRRHA